MDPFDLDAQLAQLTLMNSRPLESKNPLQSIDSSPGRANFKKVGPAVPPKPTKKHELLQQKSEMSQPLTVSQQGGGISAEKILLQKKPTQNSTNPMYGNIKMTLDNPRILEHQLEALEHHKKQLEKKGMLPEQLQQKQYSNLYKNNSVNSVNNKEERNQKSTNYPTKSIQNYNNLYSNLTSTGQMRKVAERSAKDTIYSNVAHIQHVSPAITANVGGSTSKMGSITSPDNLTYSNIKYINNSTSGIDDLPPPPPPPPAQTSNNFEEENLNCLRENSIIRPNNCTNLQIQEDELPPPPSPVSSSYSELRRATDNFPNDISYIENIGINDGIAQNRKVPDINNFPGFQHIYMNTTYENDYSTYGTSSQASSTYESIYEPINPRPPSELSSRSNYSLYTSYVNSGGMTINSGGSDSLMSSLGGEESTDGRKAVSNRKETEVEALTNLLVHSMDSTSDIDSYGICVKCGERIVGENSGCTAMEEIYHIACFTCSQCQINLQGKPFYALDDKPYCEEDYLNTLEKCSICMKPILERILRATGKPYHPECFCCVVCGNSLDGVPFTVDAANKNYCIEDFHKKFAPRCCVCKEPIMPEPGQEETVRVVAIDRSFHFECYKCEDCGLLLSSEAEGRGCYPLDEHVLCKSCNAKRVQALTNRMTTDL